MTFQKGDWVLWEGAIERVEGVEQCGDNTFVLIYPRYCVHAGHLASHQIPWHKPSPSSPWEPL